MKIVPVLLVSWITTAAWATGGTVSVPTPTTSHSSADSQSTSSARSDATSTATQTQTASGTASQSQTANGGTSQAVNNGNNASQSTEFNYPRQAPSVGQGSIAIAACGAGGNAGGSNSHGAAFLGMAFTPADCKLLLAAAAYQALGMWDSACEMVNGISTVKARWKALGVSPPSCAIQPPAQTISAVTPPVSVNVTTADLSGVATKEDLAGYVSKEEGRRIFERSVAK